MVVDFLYVLLDQDNKNPMVFMGEKGKVLKLSRSLSFHTMSMMTGFCM